MCAARRRAMDGFQRIVGMTRACLVLLDRMELLPNVQIGSEVQKFKAMIDAFFQQEQRTCLREIHV